MLTLTVTHPKYGKGDVVILKGHLATPVSLAARLVVVGVCLWPEENGGTWFYRCRMAHASGHVHLSYEDFSEDELAPWPTQELLIREKEHIAILAGEAAARVCADTVSRTEALLAEQEAREASNASANANGERPQKETVS